MKKIYLLFALVGIIVPYYFLITFVLENGFDFSLLITQLFANSISTFFAVDLIISCIVFIVFMFKESNRLSIKRIQWLCLFTLFGVGLSLALPLFLYFREDYI